MPRANSPTKLIVTGCTRQCSLHTSNLPGDWAERIHVWLEQAESSLIISGKLTTMGGPKLTDRAIRRHRTNHLRPLGVQPVADTLSPDKRKTDLEVLEIIIGRGAQQVDLASTRISAEQLLRAIELKHRLTEGSVFDSLFGALVEEGDEAFDGGPEAPEAVVSTEEAAQAAPVDVD